MGDRTLAHYQEGRNPEGPYWTLDIERSASGRPGLFFIIKSRMFDPKYEKLNREMCIVVDDGEALLAPVMEWLKAEK